MKHCFVHGSLKNEPLGRLIKKFLVGALMSFSAALGSAHAVGAKPVPAAVASNFIAPMTALVARFEADTGIKVAVSYGSSGKLSAQIRHGAPFQIFLSADQIKPKTLEKDGWVVPGSRFTYAIGALALWSAEPSFEDELLARLHSGDFNKVALANPKIAPYGVAAQEVLTALGLEDTTRSKWVLGENIAQVYQFVATKNANLGFVALAQIIDRGPLADGFSWTVPETLYQPIRQDAVLLLNAKDNPEAQAFLDFLGRPETQRLIESYGYKTE